MKLNLSPLMADKKIFEGDGGSYLSWSSSEFPLLGEAKVGAGRLLLHPRGFALPHYADSSKIGFVIQGSCIVGMTLCNTSEERVLNIKKGDTIPVPIGAVSWWFNGGDSDLVVVFIGETSKACISGEFTYFLMTGTLGVLGGFSTEFISKAYDLNKEEADNLVKSQTGTLLIKLEEGICIPCPEKDTGNELMVFNIENALPDVNVKKGGYISTLTPSKFPFLEQVGLSCTFVKIEAKATLSPMYEAGSATQVNYVTKGSGGVQIVGINGEQLLDAKVKAGELFMVPRFFVAMMVADEEGMECFSVITSPRPVFGQLNGNTSVWKALSPAVLQTSLGVTPEFAELLTSRITKSTIVVPPKN